MLFKEIENCNYNHPKDFAVYAGQLTCLEVLKEDMSADEAVMMLYEEFDVLADYLMVELMKTLS